MNSIPLPPARLEHRPGTEWVQLTRVAMAGELHGPLFQATLTQQFANPGRRPVELVYTFPLPWGAVLLGVAVDLGGQTRSAQVVAKVAAEAAYEHALSDGHAAVLLEHNPDGSHSLNLGNLAPGEQATLTLRYAQVLRWTTDGLRLLIPTVIAPRYGDPQRQGGLAPHLHANPSLTAVHPFALSLRLRGALARSAVASPSHAIALCAEADGCTVSLVGEAALDRDFVLNLRPVADAAHDGLALRAADRLAPGDPTQVLLASLRPRWPTASAGATALKLLVDCSGSMAGDSMAAARRALHHILMQLGAGDRCALSRFGSDVAHLRHRLSPCDGAHREAALRWVAALEADMGGTEMAGALAACLALSPGVPADVLLITDGEIYALDDTLRTVAGTGQRVFVVGIGSSPTQPVLQRLAEVSGGACDFVAPGEAVEPAVLRMFARLRAPRLTGVRLQWPAGWAPLWVSALPTAVFAGDSVTVWAQLPDPCPRSDPDPQPALLRLCATQASGAEVVLAELALPPAVDAGQDTAAASAVPEATAARLLAAQRCSEALAAAEAANTDGQRSHLEASCLQHALRYQLLTPLTAWLLVHERAEADRATDLPDLQPIAPMLPAGWGGWGTVQAPQRSQAMAMPCGPQSPAAAGMLLASAPCLAPGRCQAPELLPTPWAWHEWLHSHARDDWPSSLEALAQWGMDPDLIDWLAGLLASPAHASDRQETDLVGALLQLLWAWDSADPTPALTTTQVQWVQRLAGWLGPWQPQRWTVPA